MSAHIHNSGRTETLPCSRTKSWLCFARRRWCECLEGGWQVGRNRSKIKHGDYSAHFSFFLALSFTSALCWCNRDPKSGPQTHCTTYFVYYLHLATELTAGKPAIPRLERDSEHATSWIQLWSLGDPVTFTYQMVPLTCRQRQNYHVACLSCKFLSSPWRFVRVP